MFGSGINDWSVTPGWNTHVESYYDESREAFSRWREAGSPKEGLKAQNMRAAWARFKLMLRRCKANKSQMKVEAIANKYRCEKVTSFWRDVKSLNCANIKLALGVDDASTPAGIADLFKNKFFSVLREFDYTPCKLEFYNKIRVSPLSGVDFVSPEEIC